MVTWVHLPLAFGSGFIFGGVAFFLRFRSRIRLYERFIESRLASFSIPIDLSRSSVSNERIRPVA